MKQFSAIGYVFKEQKIREKDKIISILTKEFGRIDAVAKGIRNLQSKKSTNIELFGLSKFSFYKSEHIDLIIEAKLLKSNNQFISKELFFQLFYIAELIDKFEVKGFQKENSFQLINCFLQLLRKNSKQKFKILLAFELRILKKMGFLSNLKKCVKCSKAISQSKNICLSKDPGFICANHKCKNEKVSLRVFKSLNFWLNCEPSQISKLKVIDEDFKKSLSIVGNWMQSVIGYPLKGRFLAYQN